MLPCMPKDPNAKKSKDASKKKKDKTGKPSAKGKKSVKSEKSGKGKKSAKDGKPKKDRKSKEQPAAPLAELPEEWKAAIAEYVASSEYRAAKPVSLARRMGVPKKALPDFRDALAALIDEGTLVVSPQGRITPRSGRDGDTVVGVLKKAPGGAVLPWPRVSEQKRDAEQPRSLVHKPEVRELFIDRDDFGTALLGDTVRAKVTSRRRAGGQRCGRVLAVLERRQSSFVGRYYEIDGRGWCEIQGRTFEQPVTVGDPGAKGVREGDLIVVDLIRFPTARQPGEGVIADVLGDREEAGVETQQVIFEFDLPGDFPEEVLEEARRQAAAWNPDEVPGDREDLTDTTILTIDPDGARDFDDAISLHRTDDDHWHLGVHIADVAHFVEAGSPLDLEARRRGTSVYLPTQVIPMLPEVISNGLASLQEGNLRLTKSVFIEYTAEGIPVDIRLARTAIRNAKRLRYEEVLPLIEGEPGAIAVDDDIRELLVDMQQLARLLRARRFAAGSLEMHMPSLKLQLGDSEEVVGIEEEHHDESHQIIEEFMLAANVAVAVELTAHEILFPRRAHPEPDPLRLKRFKDFVAALGYDLAVETDRLALQKLLDKVRGTPQESAVNMALLRSMKQAVYTAEEIGHYALAFENYCHFTSPIRRYPDLMVHRLVDAIVLDHRGGRGPGFERLQVVCEQCSDLERRAEAAERTLTDLKLLGWAAARIGQQYEVVVTGVEKFGLFCRGRAVPFEGLLFTHELPRDYYDFDRDTYSMVGRRTGETFRLGDTLKIRIAEVDRDRRQLNFDFVRKLASVEPPSGGGGGKRREKRGSHRSNGRPGRGGSRNDSRNDSREGSRGSRRGGSGRRGGGRRRP